MTLVILIHVQILNLKQIHRVVLKKKVQNSAEESDHHRVCVEDRTRFYLVFYVPWGAPSLKSSSQRSSTAFTASSMRFFDTVASVRELSFHRS